jgi:hypothetical protein
MNIKKISITSLLKELERRQKVQEGYDEYDYGVSTCLNYTLLIVLLVISITLWVWALVVTIKHWKELPKWVQVLASFGLIPAIPLGPVITLVVVYTHRKKKKCRCK